MQEGMQQRCLAFPPWATSSLNSPASVRHSSGLWDGILPLGPGVPVRLPLLPLLLSSPAPSLLVAGRYRFRPSSATTVALWAYARGGDPEASPAAVTAAALSFPCRQARPRNDEQACEATSYISHTTACQRDIQPEKQSPWTRTVYRLDNQSNPTTGETTLRTDKPKLLLGKHRVPLGINVH